MKRVLDNDELVGGEDEEVEDGQKVARTEDDQRDLVDLEGNRGNRDLTDLNKYFQGS